jgi:alcohol dehydrogenase (NADP+)
MKQRSTDSLQKIPVLGLGTWKMARNEAGPAISAAIDIGYRHFDCASIYNNDTEIGIALSAAINSQKVRREDLWITSKLWNNAHAPKHVRPALERILKNLKLSDLALFLIHWPVSFTAEITFPKRPDQFIALKDLPIIETWSAMEKMVKKGLCRNIGVSNFNIPRLSELLSLASTRPYLNQIELHPYLQQPKMIEYCSQQRLQLSAFSPLGSGKQPEIDGFNTPSLSHHPAIKQIALQYNVSPAQVLIAWGIKRKTIVIAKSVNPLRLEENFRAMQLDLDEADMQTITQLDLGYRFLDGSFFTPAGSPYKLSDLWDA